MPLNSAFSSYLDICRFLAALVVVIGHANLAGIGGFGQSVGNYAHIMVIVFFVLSGFIVARTTIDRRSTWAEYALQRATRVYVVAVPALIFSSILAWMAFQINPIATIQNETYVEPSLSMILSSVLFLNESWQNPARVPFNKPYWSLCFEVWYYVAFGVFVFVKGWARWVGLSAIAFIAGPAIVALAPCWILGALLAVVPNRQRSVHDRWMPYMAILALLLMVLIQEFSVDVAVKTLVQEVLPFLWRLEFATRFVSDFMIAILVAVHFWAVHAITARGNRWLEFVRPYAVVLASFSFSLYIFHDPILKLLALTSPLVGLSAPGFLVTVFFVVIFCWIISLATERRTKVVRSFLARVLRLRQV